MIDKVQLYCFSPTGGTKKAADIFCEAIAREVETTDLAFRGETEEARSGVVVFALPVFGGRIPAFTAEKIGRLDGRGKQAVTIVVYGTRAYEDALLELNDVVESCGFQITASAALIAEHSMEREVGKGRPDAADRAEIMSFAADVLAKLENDGAADAALRQEVPGNRPYKTSMVVPAVPVSLEGCILCGACERACPLAAIRVAKDKAESGKVETDSDRCILCLACTSPCPQNVRVLSQSLQEKMKKMLGALEVVRRDNEFFL